jgi:hypothetical protein
MDRRVEDPKPLGGRSEVGVDGQRKSKSTQLWRQLSGGCTRVRRKEGMLGFDLTLHTMEPRYTGVGIQRSFSFRSYDVTEMKKVTNRSVEQIRRSPKLEEVRNKQIEEVK